MEKKTGSTKQKEREKEGGREEDRMKTERKKKEELGY